MHFCIICIIYYNTNDIIVNKLSHLCFPNVFQILLTPAYPYVNSIKRKASVCLAAPAFLLHSLLLNLLFFNPAHLQSFWLHKLHLQKRGKVNVLLHFHHQLYIIPYILFQDYYQSQLPYYKT